MSIIYQKHRNQHYKVIFNQSTGLQVRIEDKCYNEPFWSEDGPELIDFSITNYCDRECKFCYRHAGKHGHNISIADVDKVISEAKRSGVLQIALGGGNPNQHPQFIEILQKIRNNGIVPSYTSNGEGLTEDVLDATKKYCGAMALSVYPPISNEFIQKIFAITEKEIKLNLHIILTTLSYELLISWLANPPEYLNRVNALVILNYKPTNHKEDYLILDNDRTMNFYHVVNSCKGLNIGFDSCSVPGILSYMKVRDEFIEPCEAARFSAFISEDLKMYPCSFMADTEYYGDLRKQSLIDIWKDNKYFISHRNALKQEGCKQCLLRSKCLGGCHFMPQINQCETFNI